MLERGGSWVCSSCVRSSKQQLGRGYSKGVNERKSLSGNEREADEGQKRVSIGAVFSLFCNGVRWLCRIGKANGKGETTRHLLGAQCAKALLFGWSFFVPQQDSGTGLAWSTAPALSGLRCTTKKLVLHNGALDRPLISCLAEVVCPRFHARLQLVLAFLRQTSATTKRRPSSN